MRYSCFPLGFFSDLGVGAYTFKENESTEKFNMSLESIQNKQQYGSKITCTDISKKKVIVIRNVLRLVQD